MGEGYSGTDIALQDHKIMILFMWILKWHTQNHIGGVIRIRSTMLLLWVDALVKKLPPGGNMAPWL